MNEIIQEIEDLLFRRNAEIELMNLMGYYCHYHAQFDQEGCAGLFDLDDPQCRVEMAWGVYDGADGIRKCYGERHCQHSDPDRWHGKLFLRMVSSPCIEIAGDRKTARVSWLTPGAGGWPSDEVPGENECRWDFCKYGVDCKLVNGRWKWWHLHVFSVYGSEFYRCWKDLPAYSYDNEETVENFRTDWKEDPSEGMPNREITCWWNFESGCIYPDDQPQVPEPYENFEKDVGYGW